MKLRIAGNRLYADNMIFSHVEVKHGNDRQHRSCEVRPQYSHEHGRDLALADGLGWMGADVSCSIVVGRVIDGNGAVLPCRLTEGRLMNMLDVAGDRCDRVTMEIER